MKRADDGGWFPPLIVLAGGKSSRFGSPKGLAQANGSSLMATHVSSFAECGKRIVVVTGFFAKEYAEELGQIKQSRRDCAGVCRIECVINENPDLGPFSSVQTGLSLLAGTLQHGVFIQPIDAGPVSSTLFLQLREASREGGLSVTPVFDGKGGHPVLLSARLARRCLDLDPVLPDSRLDLLLKEEPGDLIVRLPVSDPAVLNNFNRPCDLSALQTPS